MIRVAWKGTFHGVGRPGSGELTKGDHFRTEPQAALREPTSSAGVVVEAVALTKVYSNGVQALRGVDLTLRTGEVFTLLGLNGAGKTTLLRILGTQLRPSSGAVRVMGMESTRAVHHLRERIAVVPQDATPDPVFTPWDYAYGFARLRGFNRSRAKELAHQALAQVGLLPLKDQQSARLSGGQQKRVILSAALASTADLLLLDEPSVGLDPFARRELWRTLQDIRGEGKTILLTTHFMDEAEALSDRVGVLHDGRLIVVGSPIQVKSALPYRYRVVLHGAVPPLPPSIPLVVMRDRSTVLTNSHEEASRVLTLVEQHGGQGEIEPATLEEAFLRLVEERRAASD